MTCEQLVRFSSKSSVTYQSLLLDIIISSYYSYTDVFAFTNLT